MDCPVCGRSLSAGLCPDCGYDRSRDYGVFPTPAPLTWAPPTVSHRRKERAGMLLCSKCGCAELRFRFADRNLSCARCGHLLAPQELDTVLAVMGCPPLHHRTAVPPKPRRRIIALSAGYNHTVALYSDGTAAAIGSNQSGQCDVEGWTDLIAVAAGVHYTVGLRSDHTVLATGLDRHGCLPGIQQGTTAIAAGQHTLGLRASGSVWACGPDGAEQCSTAFWQDITAVAVGGMHSVGLKKDGTIVTAGYSGEGLSDAHGWTDITAIAAGSYMTFGLKRGGTVVSAGYSAQVAQEVRSWTGITAISAASSLCIGLRSDGTVLTAGSNGNGTFDLSHWTGIRSVSAGFFHVVGLRADGTPLAEGDSSAGQCDIHKLLP